jgi:hypothetical protein
MTQDPVEAQSGQSPTPAASSSSQEPAVAASSEEPKVAPKAGAPFQWATQSPVLRNLDVVLLAVALLPALALGVPKLGYVLGAGGWILQRAVAVFDRRWTGKPADPLKQLTATIFEAFGRIWLLAGVIVAAAVLGERTDGRTASVVILGAYSVAFVIRLLAGAPRAGAGR